MSKLAAEHADWVNKEGGDVVQRGGLRIVNIEYGAARELCVELQITRLPTVQMYMPVASAERGAATTTTGTLMQKVQDFSCPPSQFHRLQDFTEFYLKKQQARSPSVTAINRAPDVGVVQAKNHEDAFEAKLDAGRDLIREKFAAQLPAAAAQLYAAAGAAAKEEEEEDNLEPTKNTRFWSRLRNRGTSAPDAP
jgi:hypothetical protein